MRPNNRNEVIPFPPSLCYVIIHTPFLRVRGGEGTGGKGADWVRIGYSFNYYITAQLQMHKRTIQNMRLGKPK